MDYIEHNGKLYIIQDFVRYIAKKFLWMKFILFYDGNKAYWKRVIHG